MQPRAQHLEWCKKRALAYCNAGHPGLAIASMFSDLEKHPKTRDHPSLVAAMGMTIGDLTTADQVREFIEGFN